MYSNFKFGYSISVNEYDRNKNEKETYKLRWKEREGTTETLINDIKNNRAFCACFYHNGDTFTNKDKSDNNLKSTHFIIFDMDAVKLTASDFYAVMITTEIPPSIVYTTANNGKFKPNKNEEYNNRYRVIYALDTPIYNASYYKEIHQALKEEISITIEDNSVFNDNSDCSVSHFFASNKNAEIYSSDSVMSLEWLSERYELSLSDNKKVSDGYIYSANEKPQGGYIISKVNDSSSNTNNHCNLNDINVHSNYIEYLLKKKLENEKPQGGYIIKKREEHYITMWRFLQQIENNEFINDYYNLSVNEIIQKYISTYPSIEFSQVEYNEDDPYYLVPSDYIEIKRKWHFREIEKENGDTYRVTEIERCKNGQGRRRRLFLNLVIRRLIYPQISFEHLLFNALYELHRYIDNNDKDDIITKKDVAEIAINAYYEDIEKWSKLKEYHKPKFKINKSFCTAHNLNARRMALKINAEQNKQARQERDAEISKYYNPQLKEKENLNVLEENGVVISLRALQRWKKENGYTMRKKNKQTTSAYKAIERENNKKVEQQPTTTIISRESANNKQIKMKRENEQSKIKVMLDGSERELNISDIRSLLFEGKTLTLTSNIIAIRAFNLNDDLKFTMAVNNSDLTPSFVTTNKSDDVVCYYILDNDLNENDYKVISNEICDELKSYIKVNLNESITTLVEGFEFERGEKFGCISNNIIYNTQLLISRYNAQ